MVEEFLDFKYKIKLNVYITSGICENEIKNKNIPASTNTIESGMFLNY
ncbi:MAG: hypothetical protein HF976_12875 [ANME-2 cluster archaeon]|nr:hypothetical protein [ANME-2 cluster archaeon]MBC2702271.1 hypothetical protein [ANME-2 cluster archaeon]MBC2706798.1 hypothetical protein [ANME-2 cluster archaeon]MBC2748186.1 hypothetical protein [ANME-2 cluster archaeon]